MKINGKLVEARYTKSIQINRNPDPPIVISLQSFNNMEEFLLICPEPKLGWITMAGGETTDDDTSDAYRKEVHKWAENQVNYSAIKSFVDIQWETVDDTKPETWPNWTDEMLNSGFTKSEVIKVQNAIFEVNGLSDEAVMDAVKNSSAVLEEPPA